MKFYQENEIYLIILHLSLIPNTFFSIKHTHTHTHDDAEVIYGKRCWHLEELYEIDHRHMVPLFHPKHIVEKIEIWKLKLNYIKSKLNSRQDGFISLTVAAWNASVKLNLLEDLHQSPFRASQAIQCQCNRWQMERDGIFLSIKTKNPNTKDKAFSQGNSSTGGKNFAWQENI